MSGIVQFESYLHWFLRIWLALAIVKMIMTYYQMPLFFRLVGDISKEKVSTAEYITFVMLTPIISLLTTPLALFDEKLMFFSLYNEDQIEDKIKNMQHYNS